jgi:hypothetical protein
MKLRTIAVFLGLALLASLPAPSAPRAEAPGFVPIVLTARPIAPGGLERAAARYGALEFRGGLTLSSPAEQFGSLSGLDFSGDGTLYGIADTGFWFAGRLVEKDGRLVGVTDARSAPLLDTKGKPLTTKRTSDAEGLRIVTRNGKETAYVSFEQVASVAAYAGPDFAKSKRVPVPLPRYVNNIERNQGLEAIASAPEASPLRGATVVIAERSLDKNGNHRGFVLGGPLAGSFSLTRSDGFDVTDAAFLPDGDLIVLERSFDFTSGLRMRLQRVSGDAIRPGATLDPETLLLAGMLDGIDNMEGLAIRVTPAGETLLTLVSDDNQNHILQRTVLLQFALIAPMRATPVADPT